MLASEKASSNAKKGGKILTDWIEEYLVNFLKNCNLTIRNVHLRFEDDHYSRAMPFALGLVCDVPFDLGIINFT